MKRGLGFNMFGLNEGERALLLNYYKRTSPPLDDVAQG